jgi:hypothetical protein
MGNRDTDRFGHSPSALEFAMVEWLLDGDDPDMFPPPWDRVAELVSTVRAPITFGELAGHERALALYRSVADWRRHKPPARGRTLTAKVGVAAGCVTVALLSAAGAAAAVGGLPAPAQRAAHVALAAFGVDIPGPGPASPAQPPADGQVARGGAATGTAGPSSSGHPGASGGTPAVSGGGAVSGAPGSGAPTTTPSSGAQSPGSPKPGPTGARTPTGGGNPAGGLGSGGSPGNGNGHAATGGQGNAAANATGNAGSKGNGNGQGNGNGGSGQGQGHAAPPSGGAVTPGAPAVVTPVPSPGHGNSAHSK